MYESEIRGEGAGGGECSHLSVVVGVTQMEEGM